MRKITLDDPRYVKALIGPRVGPELAGQGVLSDVMTVAKAR
jgi:hypothetical protein